jgi:hypothetical protein
MNCLSCDIPIELDNDIKGQLCFKCHVKGVAFGFKGAFIGKDQWNSTTIREVQRSYEDSPEFKSGKIEKIPARKELI